MKVFNIILSLSLIFSFGLNIAFGLGINDLKCYQLKGSVQMVVISKEWLTEKGEWKKDDKILEFDLNGNVTNKLKLIVISPGDPIVYKGKREIKIDSEKEYPKFILEYNNDGLLIDTTLFDENGELSDRVSTFYDYDENNNWIRQRVIRMVEKHNRVDILLSTENRSIIYYRQ
jgi:hypothetical protein